MTDSFKREIERLLDEPGGQPEADQASDRLRSRLTATLSEGLGGVSSSSSDLDTGDAASMAAFIDGQLTGAARDQFVAGLAQRPGLRADVDSAAELVSSISESPLPVPRALLARAGVQFAPAPPPRSESRLRWSLSLAALLPRQRMALAMAAALAVILAVPAGLMIGSRLGGPGGGGEPELSSVEESDAALEQACKAKAAKAEQSKMAAAAPKGISKETPKETAKEIPKQAADGSKPKDPCDRFAPNGEKKK